MKVDSGRRVGKNPDQELPSRSSFLPFQADAIYRCVGHGRQSAGGNIREEEPAGEEGL